MVIHARHYVLLLLGLGMIPLLLVLALNLLLSAGEGGGEKARLASHWQQTTRGVTYAPPLSMTRPFKALRLKDRLPEINTVVLGSSTMMGLRSNALPPALPAYNFAQTGHGLMAVIGEAEWLLHHAATVKYAVIPLDWSLGFVYAPGEPPTMDNLFAGSAVGATADAAVGEVGSPIGLGAKFQDALSLPRVKNLLRILNDALRADSPATAFRQYFLQTAGDDYRCADGTPAKDFDTIFRGTCTGFRWDGSATFGNLEPVGEREARALVARSVVPSAKYATVLIASGGSPNPAMLSRLSALARGFERKGGQAIFLLPPLLPGMERALLEADATGKHLRRTKQALADWRQRENLRVIDAGKSEDYGCVATEFVDEHHALPACYAKIFARADALL